jgi:hypothetical protein
MQSHPGVAGACGGEPSPRVAITRNAVGAIASAITPVELALLAQYLFDGVTQVEIERITGVKQTTVSARIRRAARKLKAAKIPVKLPGRGRRGRGQPVTVSPEAMDRLLIGDDGQSGRWIDADKVSRGE